MRGLFPAVSGFFFYGLPPLAFSQLRSGDFWSPLSGDFESLRRGDLDSFWFNFVAFLNFGCRVIFSSSWLSKVVSKAFALWPGVKSPFSSFVSVSISSFSL